MYTLSDILVEPKPLHKVFIEYRDGTTERFENVVESHVTYDGINIRGSWRLIIEMPGGHFRMIDEDDIWNYTING